MMDTGKFMFMCEAEGIDSAVNTRTAKVNAVIKEIRAYPGDSIDSGTFSAILAKHRLIDVTQVEIQKIQDGIR